MVKKILFLMSMSFGIILPTIAQKIPSYVPTNGLVGWWPFNGNANDESGNGNNGTVNGATLTADRNGKANSAYSFDGKSWISTISNFDQNNRSISVWFRNDSQNNSVSDFINNDYSDLKYGHTIIGMMSNEELNIQSGNYGVRTNKFMINKWNFVLITRDDSITKYYLNGEFIYKEKNDNINSKNSISNRLRVGASRTNELFFTGLIDDIAIYNRALTQEEITNLYKGCTKETATLNSTNGVVLKNASPITLSASPAGGVFAGEAITNGQFTPAKANLGTNTVNYLFTNSTGCQDTTQFKVMVYDTLGNVCSSTDTLKIKVKLTTGIYSNQTTNLSVYPNPTSDVLIIDASDVKTLSGYSYRILDIQGKEVYKAVVSNAKTEISLKTIGAKGVYILHILDANNTSIENKKIVLE
jgi:hypothetical protein